MDLVYVYKCNGNTDELRYSIRSAEKYLEFDKLFIVGRKPEFLNEKAIEIRSCDPCKNKYEDVAEKIRRVLKTPQISEDFIFMNDDFILLSEYKEILYYYNGFIKEWADKSLQRKEFFSGRWKMFIQQAYEQFPEGKWFEMHYPIVYNKRKLTKVIEKYKSKPTATLRTYYCNEYEKDIMPIPMEDYKIYTKENFEKYKGKPFISTTDIIAQTTQVKNFLMGKFPKPSKYEVVINK